MQFQIFIFIYKDIDLWEYNFEFLWCNLHLYSEAVFLVMCDHSINELWATLTGLGIDLYESRLLTAHS
jgi:hypothetical protein